MVNWSSEVLKTRLDLRMDTYPPSLIGNTGCVRAIKDPAPKQWKTTL